jgi:hypothetical protein
MNYTTSVGEENSLVWVRGRVYRVRTDDGATTDSDKGEDIPVMHWQRGFQSGVKEFADYDQDTKSRFTWI